MPATPTRAQVETQFRAAINVFDQLYRFGSVNATNFLNLLDTLEQSYNADSRLVAEADAAAQAVRSSLSGLVSRGTAQALFRPFLRAYCLHVIGRKDIANDAQMLDAWYQYFIDNTLRVQSRVFTFGTPAATAGNVGTTQILRLTRDRYNFALEAGHIDSKRARCIVDANTGSQIGRETWLVEGQVAWPDALKRSGSGFQTIMAGLTIDDSLLSNPGFQSFSGTATAPTAIIDWTSSATVNGTNYLFDSNAANRFRVNPTEPATQYSLRVSATTALTQKLTVRGTELDNNTPYVFAVVWNRAIGAASGTLVLRLGNTQNSITVSAQTGWQVSTAPPSTGWSNWYRVFAEPDLQIDIDWTRTGGDLYIAEALLLPGRFHDGTWYWILPASTAAYVAPRINDEFTWPDIATDAVIQRNLAFAWPGFYLPSANGSGVTFTEPA